jgi:hypothetical protein
MIGHATPMDKRNPTMVPSHFCTEPSPYWPTKATKPMVMPVSSSPKPRNRKRTVVDAPNWMPRERSNGWAGLWGCTQVGRTPNSNKLCYLSWSTTSTIINIAPIGANLRVERQKRLETVGYASVAKFETKNFTFSWRATMSSSWKRQNCASCITSMTPTTSRVPTNSWPTSCPRTKPIVRR